MASEQPNNSATPTQQHVDAINQLFTEFELAYHNQFHKAFGTSEQIIMAQQLWLNALSDIAPQRIIQGGRRAIKRSEYLPTIHSIRKFCFPSPEELGVPDSHSAYIEACRAPSPKNEQPWSHPIVYLAGQASDWFFIASNSEAKAYPIYKHNYDLLFERLLNGETLELPVHKALPESISKPLSKEENREKMRAPARRA